MGNPFKQSAARWLLNGGPSAGADPPQEAKPIREPSVDLRVGVAPTTRFPGAPILFYFWRLEIGDWESTEKINK